MDSNQEINKEKIMESIAKNRNLLQEKKYYEFSQKIKLLSHRKMQTKKFKEAEFLLQCGVEEIFKIPEIDEQIGLQLLKQLVEMYFGNMDLFTEQSQRNLIKITLGTRNVNFKFIGIFFSIIKKFKRIDKTSRLIKIVVDYHTQKGNFTKIQSIVVLLADDYVVKFLESWSSHEQTKKDEIPAIWCRIALIRGLALNLKAAKAIIERKFDMYENNAFFKFTLFLIKVAQIKSKEAYFSLQQNYQKFLNSDPIFKGIIDHYGQRYLNIERKGKGGIEGFVSSVLE